MFWTIVFEIYKVGNMYCPMDSICMGRWILIFISYSLPKNKMGSDVYTFSIASNSQIRDPFQSFLSTHAWLQFSIKINPIFICCLLFTFQRRHKKYDNGTRSIHIYSFRFKISFDLLLQLSNLHGSVFQIWAATFQLVYCLHFFIKMVDLTYFWNAISFCA